MLEYLTAKWSMGASAFVSYLRDAELSEGFCDRGDSLPKPCDFDFDFDLDRGPGQQNKVSVSS